MAKKGTQYSGFIKDFLQADLDVAGKPLRELVRSIAKKDNHAPPRWTTKQGRKVAGKVLEHAEFVPKLLRSMKVLKGDALADVISVLTWLSTADKSVVEKIEENKVTAFQYWLIIALRVSSLAFFARSLGMSSGPKPGHAESNATNCSADY